MNLKTQAKMSEEAALSILTNANLNLRLFRSVLPICKVMMVFFQIIRPKIEEDNHNFANSEKLH
jgi:hypothetical protein